MGNLSQCILRELELNALDLEHALVLLDDGVLGLGQYLDQIVLGKLLGGGDHRNTPDELRDHAKLMQVLGHDLRHELILVVLDLLGQLRVKANALFSYAIGHDLVESHESSAADEQNVLGIDMDELLLGMLAPPLRWHARLGALEDLEKRLLNALARHVTRDGEILGLASYLVYLVHVDDAHLRPLDVAICGCDELEQDILHVFAHIARLGQRRRVGDAKRHLKEARQRLGQKRLSRSRGAKEQDVAFGKLDVLGFLLGGLFTVTVRVPVVTREDATIVIVDGNAHRALRLLLTHYVLRELVVDLMRSRKVTDGYRVVEVDVLDHARVRLSQDVRALTYALIADKDAVSPLNEFVDLVAAPSAERAANVVVTQRAVSCHLASPHLNVMCHTWYGNSYMD